MTREQLIETLTAGTEDVGGVQFDNDRYVDWSTETADGRNVEVGVGGNAVTMDWTWSEIERLQKALTLLLLSR